MTKKGVRSRPNLTDTQRAEIIELVKQGSYTNKTIAIMYSVTPSAICNIIKKHREDSEQLTVMSAEWQNDWDTVTRKAREYISFLKKRKMTRMLEGRR